MLVTAAAAVACSKENIENHGNEVKTADYVEVSFSAAMENGNGSASDAGNAGTKTVVDGTTGEVSWSTEDCISVFDNSTTATEHNNKFTFSGESSFSGKVPEDATEFYALYPYDADAVFEQGTITATMPAEQTAVAGTFADGTAVMAGKISSGSIAFKNICSHICFTVADDITDVKSITLMGNASEALCGTFTIGWNEDEPQIALTEPETYVTLRNADGSALTPGTYWFTVLPVEFSKGFTVTLSKTDGSQKAWSYSSAVSSVGTRNRIQPIPTISSATYKDNLNYFIRYNDGFDITVGNAGDGGVTFSKETNPGGVLVNSTVGNKTIKKDGVYFICDEDTPAQISYNEVSDLVVCGADTSTRSKIEIGKTLQPETNGSGNLLFENLIITPAESFTNDFIGQKKATNNPGTEFGAIVFDSCTITTARHLIYIINAETAIEKISVLNCDYFSKVAAACVVTFANQTSTVSELNVRNNVFCNAIGVTMTDFKVLNGASATVKSINAYGNTFDHTTMVNAGCFIVKGVENCYIMYNLCNETVLTNAHSNLGNYKGESGTSIKGSVVNNYYYTSGTKSLNNALKPEKAGSPVKLSASPLSSEWNPAEGVYGTYSINAMDSKNQPGEALLKLIGAKRADMTSTSTASVNSAAYADRQEVNLGSF